MNHRKVTTKENSNQTMQNIDDLKTINKGLVHSGNSKLNINPTNR